MLTRRNALSLAGLAMLTGCGDPSQPARTNPGATQLISSDLPRATAQPGHARAAVTAAGEFTADLYARLAASPDPNLVCSPYSVATALGMTVQGAAGTTAAQILQVLHASGAAGLAAGLNSLSQALAARTRQLPAVNGEPAQRIELSAANSLWGQRGVSWERPFLDVLAREFGTGMRVVDYQGAPEAARAAINAWVSEQTRTRIPELVARGAVDPTTRLALVNALYLKAPWQTPFEPAATSDAPFHRPDGSVSTVRLMSALVTTRVAAGPGWAAAELPYAGGELAMTVILPDAGRFAAVQAALTPSWLDRMDTRLQPEKIILKLPRWSTRTTVELTDALTALGMPLAFGDDADFSGMTTQQQLVISAVAHEGFIAVDEAGTEAAAATAVLMSELSGTVDPPREFIADRPFLYLIRDVPTGGPLFIGRVQDPAVTA